MPDPEDPEAVPAAPASVTTESPAEPPGGMTMPAPPMSGMQDDSVYVVPDLSPTPEDGFLLRVHDHLTRPSPVVDVETLRQAADVSRSHLRGLLEALIFASDHPQRPGDLAKAASANLKEVKQLLLELQAEYQPRGIQLDEVAGGWVFRTSSAYAPFVRDLTKQKPVRLSRAQIETLAILAYRQPVTRPEIDDIRGVDSGPVLKMLLERDLVRILGKKDEPGRPLIYGTTTAFLEFFGLKSLKDLPTLKEFTELSEDSRRVAERELGDVLDESQAGLAAAPAPGEPEGDASPALQAGDDGEGAPHDTVPPPEGAEPEGAEPEGAGPEGAGPEGAEA